MKYILKVYLLDVYDFLLGRLVTLEDINFKRII
jgi:hypothetical protein